MNIVILQWHVLFFLPVLSPFGVVKIHLNFESVSGNKFDLVKSKKFPEIIIHLVIKYYTYVVGIL